MNLIVKLPLMVSACLLFLLALPADAYAYLDPATGSYITQIIIASIIGGLFLIKQYFFAITAIFKNLFAKTKSPAEDE
jgi:hypothetical protein